MLIEHLQNRNDGNELLEIDAAMSAYHSRGGRMMDRPLIRSVERTTARPTTRTSAAPESKRLLYKMAQEVDAALEAGLASTITIQVVDLP